MFTRLVTISDAKDIDAGIDFVRNTVTPLLHQQKGFRGTTASADRAGGVLGVLTLWDTAEDRDASESALLKVREEAAKLIGGTLSVELFEQVLVEMIAGPPSIGSSLLVTRVSMDPAKVDQNIEYFTREVLPLIKANPGLLAVRYLANRETGDALVGTAWADVDSCRAAAQAAEKRQLSGDLPVIIRERSQREIAFVDLV